MCLREQGRGALLAVLCGLTYNSFETEGRSGRRETMNPFPQRTEKETTIADVQSSMCKSAEERAAMFRYLQHTVESIWQDLSPEEIRRRREAARILDPLPRPWWKNLREDIWPTDDAATQ